MSPCELCGRPCKAVQQSDGTAAMALLCYSCSHMGDNIGELDQFDENTGDDIDYRPPEYYGE